MTLLEAIGPELPAVIAVAGFGGKTTIVRQLRAETGGADVALIEVAAGESIPPAATLVLYVAGLDVVGQPASALPGGFDSSEAQVSPEVLASFLARQGGSTPTVYVLNKTDDELSLQQARQIAAALLPERTVATVDGQLVWPREGQEEDSSLRPA